MLNLMVIISFRCREVLNLMEVMFGKLLKVSLRCWKVLGN